MTQNKLALVEIYHPHIHGSQNSKLYSHFFSSLNITSKEFMEDYPEGWIKNRQLILQQSYNDNISNLIPHPIIENYGSIIQTKNSLTLEIIQPIVITDDGYETYVCILKTFWLKCFQRKWKFYYKNKIAKMKSPKVLLNRQIYGKAFIY